MIKKRIARLSASVALFMIMLMLALPLFAFTAGAESFITDWTTDRSGKIRQIVDNQVLSDDDTNFSLSYNVKGGRDFKFHYSDAWGRWEGKVKASPGDVITVGYEATYNSLKDLYYFDSVIKDYTVKYSCREYTSYSNDKKVNDSWFTLLHDKTNDNTDGSPISGSFTLNVPKLEDLENLAKYGETSQEITMDVTSKTRIKYKDDDEQVASLSFSIYVMVDKSTAGADVGGITQNASTDNGETGTAIPAAIVLGTLSAGAGIVGAAAAAASKPTDKKDGGGSFKMLVGKNFGDGIRKGAKPVKIWARMVEIKGSSQLPRPDLNNNITVMSEEMNIISAVLTGSRVEVTVSIDDACELETATLTFIYNGEGGTFRNSIVFKVVGEPYLEFEREPSKGYGYGPYSEAIFGDKFTYKMKFVLANTTGYPQEIKAKTLTPELEVSIVRDEAVEYGYILTVVNKTKEPTKKEIFFNGEEKRDGEITAKFEDGTKLVSKVGLLLYPEGLNVTAKNIDDERIPINAYDFDKYEGSQERFAGEKFGLILAVKSDNAAKIIKLPEDEVSLNFGKTLSGDTRLKSHESDMIAEKFKFKVDPAGQGVFYFIPKDELCQPKQEVVYGVVLTAACTYKNVRYEREIPFRLIGKLPDPMGDWKTEYAALKRRVEKFTLPNEKDVWLQRLESCAANPPASVEELRMVNKEILRRYINYWTKHHEADMASVANFDALIYAAEWFKFIGDCAFSFLAKTYAGPLADAIITPSKDIVLNLAGEMIACKVFGTKFDIENLEIAKSLNTAGDLVSQNMATSAIKANPKKWFYYIAAYLSLSVFRNYFYILNTKGKSDFYGAITASFKDLTVGALKVVAGELFNKWLDCKSFKGLAGGKIANFLATQVQTAGIKVDVNVNMSGIDIATQQTVILTKYSDAVSKYLVRTVGMATARVIQKFSGSEFGTNEDGSPVYCFPLYEPITGKPIYIEINLRRALTYTPVSAETLGAATPFLIIFDLFFSGITGSRKAITFPKDPPIERTGKTDKT